MKKTTKTNAPASEKAAAPKKAAPVATSPTPAPAKTTTTPRKTPRSAATAPVPAAPPPAARKEPAPAPRLAPTVITRVVVRVDVGFGNALHIRGVGPGLSWEQGVALDCLASDEWVWASTDAERPVAFKILLNDATWCAGEDLVVEPGATIEVVPTFS